MNKKRKKIINIISIFIIIGGLALAGFSPVFVDMLKKASAQNEGEIGDNVVITEDVNTEVTESTEMSYDTLGIEDTIYAVSMGEGEGHIQLSSITDVNMLDTGKNYMVETYDDWKKLYDFSQVSTLKDINFWLYYPGQSTQSKPWELTSEHIKNGIGSKEHPFSGVIKPFYTDMTIKTSVPLFAYLSSDAMIGNADNNNNPMTIANTIVSMGEGNGAGGLAANYVIKAGEKVYLSGENSKFKNIKITGTITQVKGTVGGLFGNVILADNSESGGESTEVSAEIILDSDSISVEGMTEVSGYIAGGLFGEVSGNITMTLNSMPSVAAKVYGYYDGYKSGVAWKYNDGFISQMKICAGGLIGKMKENAVLQTGIVETGDETENGTYFTIKNKVMSDGISGGLVGAVRNSTVNVSHIEKDSVEEASDIEPYVWARYIGGGFIGLSDSSKIELAYLKLDTDVRVCYTGSKIKSSAGGIIGRYETDSNDKVSYLKISNLLTSNDSRVDIKDSNVIDTTQRVIVNSNPEKYNNSGGVIGSCNGNNVEIKDLEFSLEAYNVSLHYVVNSPDVPNHSGISITGAIYTLTGAIAGSLSGMAINIDSIEFDLKCDRTKNGNGLSGYSVGDIAGQVGLDRSVTYDENLNTEVVEDINVPTKMNVSNITVTNSYAYTVYKYHGGLFGYVGKGAIICLSESIDISRVPFQTFTGNFANRVNAWAIYVMLAPTVNGGSRGLIAGYVEESLIYFEEHAEVKRSIIQNEGEIASNMIERGNAYVTFDPNNGTYFEYVIDDIGNAGSVFQNFSENGTKIIDYAQAYGKEVTGKIGTSDGKYVIDSLGDALRLAIVGQTYDMATGNLTFAANCFADGTSISDILSADYLITTDLNLGAANIQSFLRSDAILADVSTLGFSGSMEGQASDNTYPTITMNSISRHKNGGLYPLLQSSNDKEVTFKNLTIDGYLYYHPGTYNSSTYKSEGGSGSIAARAVGSCTFENITIKTKIKGDMYNTVYSNERMYSHGGLIGEYQLNGGTLKVTGCEFSPVITTIRSNQFVGGMIGRIDTSNQLGNIIIKNCSVGAKIIADANYLLLSSSDTANKFHARTAGLISFIGNDYVSVSGVDDWYKFYPGTVEDKTYANITIDGIELKGATIDLSATKNQYVNISGGLLGYAWCNVEAELKNISVGTEDTNDRCVLNSLGYVGGLVSFVAGKFDLTSISLKELAMTSIDTGRSYCSFLFGNGECAYITIDQATYEINTDGKVTQTNYSDNFDEIVGTNIQWKFNRTNDAEFNAEIYANYRDGGIVNIINSSFSDFDSDSNYQSYINRVCDTTNQYTRYYYNLFTENNDSGWNITTLDSDMTIDSPKKLMTWHVGNYANSKLSRFFKMYFGGNESYRNVKKIILSGTINMNGYSLYPTSVDGVTISGEGAKIILYGEDISNLESGLYSSYKNKVYRNNDLLTFSGDTATSVFTQHYMMHASLLYCVDSATVSNVTVGGTIANNGEKSGSLIGGYGSGTIVVSGITFEGIRISHYAETVKAGVDGWKNASLMLGKMGTSSNGSVTANIIVDGITMNNYDGVEAGTAAAALISQVGDGGAKNVQISFVNIKLPDVVASSPFQYATLLYSFQYSSDSTDNKAYGIYTFNYLDTVIGTEGSYTRDDHNVTYGYEIKDGLHYDDYYLDEITAKGWTNPLIDAITEASSNTYLPYVYADMDIYVNPKSGNITKGCGTYEDPYIIENVSQFFTLFCYLSGEHETYHAFLNPQGNPWEVVPIGGDGDAYECNESHDNLVAKYGEDENFPTADDMRTAYYMITNDLDLVNGGDMNYSALVKRFSGLGSYKYPFSGVIVGKKSDNKVPTVTLPGNDLDYTRRAYFGLIEYMQGAVVKDLNIKNNGMIIVQNYSGGGVAAIILGGDNIIDNVTVSVKFRILNSTVGGYVGTIENGSLILRNIENQNVVKDCYFYNHFSGTTTAGVTDCFTQAAVHTGLKQVLTTNKKVGLLVGTVKDGYVLYDGNAYGSSKKILTNDDIDATGLTGEVSPLINGFELINGAALEATGKILTFNAEIPDLEWIKAGTNCDFWFQIQNTEQLEILSLALNSDSLSVYIDTEHSDADNRTEHLSGYDYTAKCRKATYADVGTNNAKFGQSSDCIFAKAYDDGWIASGTEADTTNMNYYVYPYLCYKYMEFNGWGYNNVATNYVGFKTTIYSDAEGTKFISKINKADDNVSGYTTGYQLYRDEDTRTYVYDLSDYKNSFRGIGALYSKEYSDFRGNFDGNGYSVKIRMERDWDSTLAITGMFNSLTYHNKDDGANKYLSIQNLTIVDSAFENIMNTETMVSVKSTNELQGTSCGAATGALAGEIEGAWYINNVTFKRTEAAQPTETVSLLAALSDEDYTKELVCGVRGYMNVGGLIGRVNVTGTDTVYGNESVHNKSNDIMLVNCNIEGYSTDKAVNIQAGSDSFAAGGLIGSIGANINTKNQYWNPVTYFYFGKVSFVGCSVTNANILAKNSGFLGGFAGTVGYRHASYYRSVGSVNVLYATENSTTIYNKLTNVKIISENETEGDEYDKYSAGGVFGQVDVLATKPLEEDSDGTTYRNVNIGSITDECTLYCINLDNVTVNIHSTNYNESSSTYNDSMQRNGIGGLVGYVNCRKMSIYDATVANSNIGVDGDVYAKTNVGGLIGYSSSCSEGKDTTTYGFYTNFLAASVVEVKNSKIMCDQPCASAGGFIGYLSTDVVSMWADGSLSFSKSEGNTISSKGTDSHAGGVIGNAVTSPYKPLEDSRATSSFKSQHWLYHIDVLKNYITSADGYAGGMIGNYAGANYIYGNMYLGYIRVGNQEDYAGINQNGETIVGDVSNQIVGSVYAGGLCGFTHQWTGFVYSAPIRIGTINENNYYNTISAKVSGGLFGRHSSNYEYFQTDEIEIYQNRIAATSKNQIAYGEYTVSGGACGIREYVLADSIKATYKIKENVIIATGKAGETANKNCKFSCGGIYGKSIYTGGNTLQYFDDIVLSNNSIGYYPLTTTSKNDMTAIVEEIKKLTNKSKEVCLLERSSSGFTYGNWRTFTINESNVGDYSDRIGNFFGEYVNGESSALHCMILRPTVEYSDEIGSIPAIDVGQLKDTYRKTVSPAEYGLAYPYAYRSKCHIIYLDDYKEGNIVDISSSENGIIPTLSTDVLMEHGTTTVTTINGDGTTSENEVPVYETEYFFGGIEQIVSKYETVKNSETTDSESESETVSVQATYAFLTSKRLDISLGGNENSNLICASPDEDDYFESTYVNDKEQYNGVPVIEVDGQSVQYIGDYVAEILTNGGGICKDSNTFKNFLTISCVNAYIAPDGTIYAIDGDGKVGSTEETHKPSIVVTDNEISSEDCPYDVVIEIDGKTYYTISLLCYTYHSYNYDRTENKETIYIPVFVTKKVTVNSYLSILEGEEYSLEQAAVNGYNNAVISHDSTYTVYAEFVYDDVRKEDGFKDIKMEKTLVFETNKGDGYAPINMQSGTKYTLIDVQTGKEYYYEVPEGGVSQIPFSYFLDADGKPYSQRNIGDEITTTKTDYTSIIHKDSEDTPDSFEGEVGLEQFFIVVRPSGKDNNMSFRLSIDAKAVDANNEKKEESVRKFLTEGVNITNIYGPLIGFEGVSVTDNVLSGTVGVTEITGKISREETLTVDGRIRISVVPESNTNSNPNNERGGSPYWVNKANGNTIDSSNTGKYLEIGVTLIDEDGQEVQWPEGTNVIMNGGSPKPLQGNSVIYTYKDNGETFAFDTLSHDIANGVWYYYNVSSDDNTPEYRWITYDSNGKWYYKEYQRGANGNLILSTVKLEDSFVFDNDKVIVSNQCHLEFDFSVADIKDYAGKSYTVRINLYRSSDPEFPLEEAGVAVADGSIREYAKTIFAEGAADLAAAITPDNLLDLGINLYQNDQTTHEISFSNKLDFTDLISEKEPKLSADVAECAAQKYMVTYRIYKKTLISEGSGYQYELVKLNDVNSPFTLYQVDGNGENQTETVIPIKEITMADGTIEYAFVASQKFTTDEIKAGTDGKTAYVTSWNMKLKIDSKKMTDSDLANYKIEATYLPYSQDEIPENDEESTLKDYFIFTIAKLKTDF